MNIDSIIALLGAVSTTLVTLRGFSASKRDAKIDNESLRSELMEAISKRTVSLEVYQAKVRETHGELNATRETVLLQKIRIDQLERDLTATNAVIRALERSMK